MSGAQAGAPIEAVLIGVDTSSGKVWLSMRQVQPDPLQETLNALLAQGPPAGGAGGSERAELTPATDLNSDPVDFNEDESMVCFCWILLSDVQSLGWCVETIELQTSCGCIESRDCLKVFQSSRCGD